MGDVLGFMGRLVALDAVQSNLGQWVARTFGARLRADRHERAMRLLEEAVEVAQAEGVRPDEVERLVAHVYAKPAGDARSEAGAVGVTWLAYCDAVGAPAADLLEAELARVYAIPRETWERRHAAKTAKGLAGKIDPEAKWGVWWLGTEPDDAGAGWCQFADREGPVTREKCEEWLSHPSTSRGLGYEIRIWSPS